MNCIEVVRAVQTQGQRNSKDPPIQQKELNVKEKSVPVSSNLGPSTAPKILARPISSANEKTNSMIGPNGKTNFEDQIHPLPMGLVPVVPQFSGLPNPISEPIQRESSVGKPNGIRKPNPIGGESILRGVRMRPVKKHKPLGIVSNMEPYDILRD